MIASLIGAGAGLASSIWGGISAKKQAHRAKGELDRLWESNEDWYRRRYNEDATQTAEAQAMIRRAREEAQRQLQQARGVDVVMGGTGEGVARAQEAGNRLISNAIGQVANNATARRDNIERQYRAADAGYGQQLMNVYNQRSANATNAANAGMQAGMGLIGADVSSSLQSGMGLFESLYKKSKEEQEEEQEKDQ